MALSGLNEIKLWREHQILGGLDVLKARCLDHHYPLHTHDTFVIASFKEGAQKHKIAQKSGVAYPGTVMVIPPGEVHTGEGANRREGWAYSAFYPTADSLEQIASNLFRGTRGSLDFGTSFLIEDPELARAAFERKRNRTAVDQFNRASRGHLFCARDVNNTVWATFAAITDRSSH